MRKLLFVDDEPNVLDGLRRILRPYRDEWDPSFAQSGQQALEMLEQEDFDVVVSDMRMPGMDGAALMAEVKQRHPHVVRILLSGQSDEETLVSSLRSTHRFLGKPCDPDRLRLELARAFALRDLLRNHSLRRLVAGLDFLPSPLSADNALARELDSDEVSVQRVARLLSRDTALVAKLLQLANSAYFSMAHHVSSVEQAVTILGTETIKLLVSALRLFGAFGARLCDASETATLHHHSVAVGSMARAIAQAEMQNELAREDALMAGFLHDVGKLVLMWRLPDEYKEAVRLAARGKIPSWEAEQEVLGATHAEVGAYLLGLWGLPDPVIEALAFHHRPRECAVDGWGPVVAVHVGDAFSHGALDEDTASGGGLDTAFLEQLELHNRLPAWREVCRVAIAPQEDRRAA